MSYEVIKNFQGGLDARRFFLSLPAGTLTQLINAHITQGGEIEKRKQFLQITLPSGSGYTFGGQETDNGIVVFGSASAATVGALSSPFIYQQLVHPDGVTPMSALISSTQFGGQIFAVAKFTDGFIGHYFGGVLIPDFTDGLAQTNALTPFDMAVNIAAAINRSSNYTATPPTLPAALTLTVVSGTASQPAVAASDIITITQQAQSGGGGSQVVINGRTYTFVKAITNTTPNQVLLAGSPQACLQNLFNAISLTGSALTYSSSTPANTDVTAGSLNLATNQFTVTNNTAGAAGNSMAVSVSNFTGASWATPTLTGGSNAVAGAGNLIELDYDFGTAVVLTPHLTTSIAQIAVNIPFNTSLSQTATDIATAINAATDAYAGGPGDNLGFNATASGATVTITPPLPVSKLDELVINTDSGMQITTPVIVYEVDIYSTPSAEDGSPYVVSLTVDSSTGIVSSVLKNTGFPTTSPAKAVGAFQIVAGGQNNQATVTLTSTNVNPTGGNSVTIGMTTYTFVTKFTGAKNEILIQNNADGTMNALIAAINNAAGSGTTYSADIQKNAEVIAGTLSAHAFVVTSIVGGTPGNAIATYTNDATLSFGATTLTGGGPDTNKITQVNVGGTDLLTSYVQFNQTAVKTATDVAAAINAQTALTGFSAVADNGVVTISTTSAGTSYNGEVVTVTCAGNVCCYNCNFSLSSFVANTSNVSSIAQGATNIMTATITYQDAAHSTETTAQFVARIAANINANTGTSGWLAFASGDAMWISKAIVASSDTIPVITVTFASLTVTGASSSAMTVSVTPTIVTFPAITSSSLIVKANAQPVVNVTGGLYPYTYLWAYAGTGTPKVICSDKTSASPTWSVKIQFGAAAYIEPWSCTVKDSSTGTSVTPVVNFYVPPGF
ncbi:MAG: hypothetical protein KGL39_31270 [Patescibacteria group bacterium]|nr:hypothetical protein [Patescibacteria group bacterium]